jgi:deoxyribonuclease-4
MVIPALYADKPMGISDCQTMRAGDRLPLRIGAHVPPADPLGEAAARAADCVQIFLSNPQSWHKPIPRTDAVSLRRSDVPIYVHAPYLVNLASANNRVRIPSRTILQDTCDAAAAIGAAAVVVHGGHVGGESDLEAGFRNWRKALERLETHVQVLIENTAGGGHALARSFDTLARLWEHVEGFGVGFCLDICHAHAAGEQLASAVEVLRRRLGRIDLLHANDSKDDAGSGRDRHENLGADRIPPEVLTAICRDAQAPIICETPGGEKAQAHDIAWLRRRLSP